MRGVKGICQDLKKLNPELHFECADEYYDGADIIVTRDGGFFSFYQVYSIILPEHFSHRTTWEDYNLYTVISNVNTAFPRRRRTYTLCCL